MTCENTDECLGTEDLGGTRHRNHMRYCKKKKP